MASRDVVLNGLDVAKGDYLGLEEGDPVVGGSEFDLVARAVVDRVLGDERELLTILAGEDAPELDDLLEAIASDHPGIELDVQDGGQPHYHLLISAE